MKNKANRMKLTQAQTEGYEKAIKQVIALKKANKCDFQSAELKMLDLVRVILKGGWTIDQSALQEIV